MVRAFARTEFSAGWMKLRAEDASLVADAEDIIKEALDVPGAN